MEQRDIFLCHASEDKSEIVEPIVSALRSEEISFWYDEAEIIWGDSIVQRINEGLEISKFVVVVFSESFISKNWPQRELNSAINIESSTGEVRVLPLLVDTDGVKNKILSKYPLLNDKRYLVWKGNATNVISELKKRLNFSEDSQNLESPSLQVSIDDIPMPKIKKTYTQRDKDLYLKKSFELMKSYFQQAISLLEAHTPEIETDLTMIHNFKFVATIYMNGDVANKCKIWLGGPFSHTIAYQNAAHSFESDNSFNDWLAISDSEDKLGFTPSGMSFDSATCQSNDILSAKQAAEYFWRRFTDRIN